LWGDCWVIAYANTSTQAVWRGFHPDGSVWDGVAPSTWSHVYVATIDPSLIDEDLSNFPVLLHLSAVAGVNCTDVTDIFDEVGDSYLKRRISG